MNFQCHLHPENQLNLICIDETCPYRDLICEKCLEEKHGDHLAIPHDKFLMRIFKSIGNQQSNNPETQDFQTSEAALLFDIRKNTEIIRRYINEIKAMESELLIGIQKNFERLNKQIYLQEEKINDSIEFFNTKKICDEMPDINNIEKYSDRIRKLIYAVKFKKEEDRWNVLFENVNVKRKKEIHQLEFAMRNFKKIFHQNLSDSLNNLNKIFDLKPILEQFETYFEVQKTEPIIIESSSQSNTNTMMNMINENPLKNPEQPKPSQEFIKNYKQLDFSHQIPHIRETFFNEPSNIKKIIIKKQTFTYEGIEDSLEYKSSAIVSCHFCQSNSSEKNLYKKLGNLYGPYKINDNSYYFHEMCILWSYGTEMNAMNSITQSVEEEVQRTSRLKCLKCEKFGAGVHCLFKGCKIRGHFKCIIEMRSLKLNYTNLGFYCQNHFNSSRNLRKTSSIDQKSKKIKKQEDENTAEKAEI